tara:strand:- start:1947 stop:2315 length:369 start_codon:yes stop_codon:yes gene_type:complete
MTSFEVSAEVKYLEDDSIPEGEQYVFQYVMSINNSGHTGAQLVNRHWIITDGKGNVEEVRGAGVVGKQPFIGPGDKYRYVSGAILETPVGTMEGDYEFIDSEGNIFLVPIPRFSLVVPGMVH